MDATALVALFLDEPAADEVAQMIREGETRIASPTLAETIDVLVRVNRIELDEVGDRLVPLLVEALEVVSVDEVSARRAARIRIDHYEARLMPLSLADCLMLGAAIVLGDSIATSDGPVAEVARLEDIDLVALPDSSGDRP